MEETRQLASIMQANRTFFILVAIALAGVLALYFTLNQRKDYAAFMKTAVKVQAELLSKGERVAEPKTKRIEYYIGYRYKDNTGSTHTVQRTIEYPDMWQDLRQGQVLTVYYNPVKPSESYPVELVERRMGLVKRNAR